MTELSTRKKHRRTDHGIFGQCIELGTSPGRVYCTEASNTLFGIHRSSMLPNAPSSLHRSCEKFPGPQDIHSSAFESLDCKCTACKTEVRSASFAQADRSVRPSSHCKSLDPGCLTVIRQRHILVYNRLQPNRAAEVADAVSLIAK